MKTSLKQILAGKIGKASAIAVLSTAAIGLAAPSAFATAQSNWVDGCRGYWYSTTGHAYCDKATRGGTLYQVLYNCNNEVDEWEAEVLPYGYRGKWSSGECIFKINSTKVY